MTEDNELWERQPWDTDASFFRFQTYYLSQRPPRSLNEAYRSYRLSKGIAEATNKKAPGVWTAWAYPDGEDSKTWPERARAYDDHLAQLQNAEWERQHMNKAETLALIAELARQKIGPGFFFKEDFIDTFDTKGFAVKVKKRVLDWDKINKYGHLLKSVSDTSRGQRVEMASDRLKALEMIGKSMAMFTDISQNYTIDLGNATDDQLERLAAGEHPAIVFKKGDVE